MIAAKMIAAYAVVNDAIWESRGVATGTMAYFFETVFYDDLFEDEEVD